MGPTGPNKYYFIGIFKLFSYFSFLQVIAPVEAFALLGPGPGPIHLLGPVGAIHLLGPVGAIHLLGPVGPIHMFYKK